MEMQMRTPFFTTALLLLGATLSAQAAPAVPAPAPGSQSPNVGDVPPDFTLTGATRFGVLNRPVRLSDLGAYLGRWNLDSRYLFIIGPDGKVAFRQTPFLETDPTAYTSLAAAVDKTAPADAHDGAVKE